MLALKRNLDLLVLICFNWFCFSLSSYARCFDNAKNCYSKGFRMLMLGWSDGKTFIPLDFALLSWSESQQNGISTNVDKRSSGYKKRLEALKTMPELIPKMINRALSQGIVASYG